MLHQIANLLENSAYCINNWPASSYNPLACIGTYIPSDKCPVYSYICTRKSLAMHAHKMNKGIAESL